VADKTAQTIYIDADPSTVMDVIADIGSYPDWVAEYKETEVLEADDEGYPKTARWCWTPRCSRTPWCCPTTGPPTASR
jgi:ribosome-associated toxin RatA of RatAB toxin-antitoxin module